MPEPTTNPLMQRVLRFLDYNTELYVRHRQRGDYHEAVRRLRRVSRLVEVAEQAEREGKSQLSWMDQATFELAREHAALFLEHKTLDSLPDRQVMWRTPP